MKLKVWHIIEHPGEIYGIVYLHREVEDFMASIIDKLPEDMWQAPDLAGTDPAGLTTFVAAFGLGNVSVADVTGMGALAHYPGEMVLVGLARKNPDYDKTMLRIRGLVVDRQHLKKILVYVKNARHKGTDGNWDLIL